MNICSVDDNHYVTLPGEPAAIRIKHTMGLLNGLRKLRDYWRRADVSNSFIHAHELSNSEVVVFPKTINNFTCALCGGCTGPAADIKYSDKEADVFHTMFYCHSCIEDIIVQLESFTEDHTDKLLGDVL